jgi:hypothetical protein
MLAWPPADPFLEGFAAEENEEINAVEDRGICGESSISSGMTGPQTPQSA